jgi:hypothetical protein
MDNQVPGLYYTAIFGIASLSGPPVASGMADICAGPKKNGTQRIPKTEPSFKHWQEIRKATQVLFQVRPTRPWESARSESVLASLWHTVLSPSFIFPAWTWNRDMAWRMAMSIDFGIKFAALPTCWARRLRLTRALRELKQCCRTSMSVPLKVSSASRHGSLLL